MFEDDEVWDEERWEAFLRENDRRLARYMELLFGFISDNPPPERRNAEAFRGWEEALRRFLSSKGFAPDDVFPRFLEGEGDDAGDMSTLPLDEPDNGGRLDPFRTRAVYGRASDLADDVLEWSNALPARSKDSTFVHFCSHVTQIPGHLAKGHGIGYEKDTLGGNIACAKRGLAAANEALSLLRSMKTAAFLPEETYLRFYERLFELRNMLGIYVQDLRGRFDLGID